MGQLESNCDDNFKSSLGFKNFPTREKVFKNPYQWLRDKSVLDGAEGLWRVHDDIYDLSNFIQLHPGGKFYLEVTKGLDITEAFECHHISTVPEETLKRYCVGRAKTPRNSPYIFEDDGFYRTLKRNVREAIKTIPTDDVVFFKVFTDTLLIALFVTSVVGTAIWSYTLAIVAGVLLSFTVIASHNYYHQRDNIRMYYTNLGMMQLNEWRIIHNLSHHLYTNSITDLQVCIAEPLLQFFPHKKAIWIKFASWIYAPFLLWPLSPLVTIMNKVYQGMVSPSEAVTTDNLVSASLPAAMYMFGSQPFWTTIGMWVFILAINNVWFNAISLFSSHFHPEIFIDGDQPRPETKVDWGICQMDSVFDRHDYGLYKMFAFLTFGDHAIHHLFPALDYAIVQQLHPVVEETLKKFGLNPRKIQWSDLASGYFKQLAKDKPNPTPPNYQCKKILDCSN